MIKTLMFDLGGVIMEIERMNAVKALEALGMRDVDKMLGDYGQTGPFLQLEKGEISPEEFHREIHKLMPSGVTDDQIDEAFEKFLVGIPVERLRKLEELHKKYNIYQLSNTNKIMWDGFITKEFRKDGHDMSYYFDGTVASFEAKAYKPDAEIFRIAERRFGIKPEETIFFDDSKANCEAAAKLGFRTEWIGPENPIT